MSAARSDSLVLSWPTSSLSTIGAFTSCVARSQLSVPSTSLGSLYLCGTVAACGSSLVLPDALWKYGSAVRTVIPVQLGPYIKVWMASYPPTPRTPG